MCLSVRDARVEAVRIPLILQMKKIGKLTRKSIYPSKGQDKDLALRILGACMPISRGFPSRRSIRRTFIMTVRKSWLQSKQGSVSHQPTYREHGTHLGSGSKPGPYHTPVQSESRLSGIRWLDG